MVLNDIVLWMFKVLIEIIRNSGFNLLPTPNYVGELCNFLILFCALRLTWLHPTCSRTRTYVILYI
jgi:hypothetical protein